MAFVTWIKVNPLKILRQRGRGRKQWADCKTEKTPKKKVGSSPIQVAARGKCYKLGIYTLNHLKAKRTPYNPPFCQIPACQTCVPTQPFLMWTSLKRLVNTPTCGWILHASPDPVPEWPKKSNLSTTNPSIACFNQLFVGGDWLSDSGPLQHLPHLLWSGKNIY